MMNNEIKYLDSQILTLKSNSRIEMCNNPSMIHNVQIIVYEQDPQLTLTYFRFNGEKYSTNITYPCILFVKNAHIQFIEFSSSKDFEITFIKQPIVMPINFTSHIANEISVLPIPLSSSNVNITNDPLNTYITNSSINTNITNTPLDVNVVNNNSVELTPIAYSISTTSNIPRRLYDSTLYVYYFRLYTIPSASIYLGDSIRQNYFANTAYEWGPSSYRINLYNVYIKTGTGNVEVTAFRAI